RIHRRYARLPLHPRAARHVATSRCELSGRTRHERPHHRAAGRDDHPRSREQHPDQGPPSVTRIAHLGIRAFHRAHQAWYTQRADDGWSIAGFTGRTPQIADALTAQGNRYALIERGVDGDRFETVTVLTEAR